MPMTPTPLVTTMLKVQMTSPHNLPETIFQDSILKTTFLVTTTTTYTENFSQSLPRQPAIDLRPH